MSAASQIIAFIAGCVCGLAIANNRPLFALFASCLAVIAVDAVGRLA